MRVKVLFFATLKERAGTKSVEIDIPENTTVKRLKEQVVITYPNLTKSMETVIVALNKEFAFDDALIPKDAEIAFFPPVSGGRI